MYQIHSGVPAPTEAKRTREAKYPFKDMQEGDCFIVPVEELPPRGIDSIRSAVYSFKRTRKVGWTFTISALDDGSVGVWRIA